MQNLYKKENFKPENKPMTENSQDELQKINNQSAKPRANIRWELEGEKCSKTFKVLDGQNMQNQAILNYIN